jgi:acyl-coenzyme A synthetase/AMP-(fatty) acid ligase
MSMSVEGVAAMQACARIGATHSVVFGGFSARRACATASRTPAPWP